jgi:hypothetical protein
MSTMKFHELIVEETKSRQRDFLFKNDTFTNRIKAISIASLPLSVD